MPAIQNVTSSVLRFQELGDIFPSQVLSNVDPKVLRSKEIMSAMNAGKVKVVGNRISQPKNGAAPPPSPDNTLFHYLKRSLEYQKRLLEEQQRTNALLSDLLKKESPVVVQESLAHLSTGTVSQPSGSVIERPRDQFIPKMDLEGDIHVEDNVTRSSSEKARLSRERLKELKNGKQTEE